MVKIYQILGMNKLMIERMLRIAHNLLKTSDYLKIHFHPADNTHKCSNVKSVPRTSQMFLNYKYVRILQVYIY
jgi:hypothetical protein